MADESQNPVASDQLRRELHDVIRRYGQESDVTVIRTRLKSGGFRWTPSLGVWQAYRHNHTIALAKEIAE